MSNYGLTPNGPNIKRLDTIVEDIHAGLSERWGVNTRQNPESFLNHLLINFADAVAELWEFGESIYFSQYPTYAEGVNLDNAAQYGGATREAAKRSYYPIHCTGREGTVLASGTMISTVTNPPTLLVLAEEKTITRSAFNQATIKVASATAENVYTIALNGAVYSFVSANDNAVDILRGLAEAITDNGFSVSVDEVEELMEIVANDVTSTNVMVLSANLTTDTVCTLITFGTEETGDILLPNGVITHIIKADAGLLRVNNLCNYIAGRKEETDAEFRRSYADKIFNRSSMMLESIRSAILNNVQGVRSVAPYENPTNEVDALGRPPHSIEIVVDGGNSTEIAKQILSKKAGGINTFGSVEVALSGQYDEDIMIRFNRPTTIYTWFRLGITLKKNETIPPNYVKLLRGVILENMDRLAAGSDVIPQEFMSELYKVCSGISYIDIRLFSTDDSSAHPESYPDRMAEITARQRAYTTEEMIEVEIDG